MITLPPYYTEEFKKGAEAIQRAIAEKGEDFIQDEDEEDE